MEIDDFDETLFGISASQDYLQDFLSDESGDELLLGPIEDEPISWMLQNSPQLRPTPPIRDLDENLSIDNARPDHIGVETRTTTRPQGAHRDR